MQKRLLGSMQLPSVAILSMQLQNLGRPALRRTQASRLCWGHPWTQDMMVHGYECKSTHSTSDRAALHVLVQRGA